jgi:hypothetical protein
MFEGGADQRPTTIQATPSEHEATVQYEIRVTELLVFCGCASAIGIPFAFASRSLFPVVAWPRHRLGLALRNELPSHSGPHDVEVSQDRRSGRSGGGSASFRGRCLTQELEVGQPSV